jgi:alanine racemase
MSLLGSYSTWIEVNSSAIENNTRLLQQMTGVGVMAVVKANGYGHGAVPVVQAALRGGASCCGVARVEEALELRQAGIDCPVLILGYTPVDKVEAAIANDISMAVWNLDQFEVASAKARDIDRIAKLHLKVDTGMSRLGAIPDDAVFLARSMLNSPFLYYEGVFTHFARADEPGDTTTKEQESCFREVLHSLSAGDLIPPKIHAANSAATISHPDTWFNMIRPGIALYGLNPSPECRLPSGFKPALEWKTVISQIKILPRGRGVSYGHLYRTARNERIGTIPVGYADGYRRMPGNQVLIRGKFVPVVGRVCMDQVMVQLDHVPDAQEGDEVVLIGSQGDQCLTVDDIAATWKTVNYELVCGLGARVPRVHH